MLVAANEGTTFALLAGQGRDELIAAEADQPHIGFFEHGAGHRQRPELVWTTSARLSGRRTVGSHQSLIDPVRKSSGEP
jgi:hypothetical protein